MIRELFALVEAAGLTVTLDGEPVASPDDDRFVQRVAREIGARFGPTDPSVLDTRDRDADLVPPSDTSDPPLSRD